MCFSQKAPPIIMPPPVPEPTEVPKPVDAGTLQNRVDDRARRLRGLMATRATGGGGILQPANVGSTVLGGS